MHSDIGVVGLGVMGKNIALNIADAGFRVSVFNRTFSKTEKFLQDEPHENIHGFSSVSEFCASLGDVKKVLLMVKAGAATDATIDGLIEYLGTGDVIIDGGNAHWKNTIRRTEMLASHGIDFIGSGISGGEEGARNGPSLMPGGSKLSYERIRPIWEAIAAKDFSGEPCTTYVGDSSAGNFVKMVHNGIEYAMMQAIAEVYDICRSTGMNQKEMHQIFADLNQGHLESFLMEISRDILLNEDPDEKGWLLANILDEAKSKGTGGWTVQSAIDLGVPVPSISAALMARQISAREWRFALQNQNSTAVESSEITNLDALRGSLELAYLGSYLQGLDCIAAANDEHKWGINLEEVIRIWQGGCIIRSKMLTVLPGFFGGTTGESELKYEDLEQGIPSSLSLLRTLTSESVVPIPVLRSTLDYFGSIYAERLPTNMIQAQRDYFGSHTFRKRNDASGTSYHHEWRKYP